MLDDQRNLNEVIGETVQWHRERLGMSQTELARRMSAAGANWHQMTVARTESAARPLRLDEAAPLAQIFDIEVSELMTPTAPLPVGAASEFLQALLLLRSTIEGILEEEAKLPALQQEFQHAAARYDSAYRLMEKAKRVHDEARERLDEVERSVASGRRVISLPQQYLRDLRHGRELSNFGGVSDMKEFEGDLTALLEWARRQIAEIAEWNRHDPEALARKLGLSELGAQQVIADIIALLPKDK